MKFLVILLGLILTATWLKEVDRFDDSWFGRYQLALRKSVGKLKIDEKFRLSVALGAIYGVLLGAVMVLEALAEGVFYGVATMLLHLFVLLFAMDRTQPGRLARDFLKSWSAGNRQGCVDYLQAELSLEVPPNAADGSALVGQFKRLLAYRSFERMFMMYTLYMLAGPEGVMFGAVIRGEKIITPRSNTVLNKGDLVVIFVRPSAVREIERLFAVSLEFF